MKEKQGKCKCLYHYTYIYMNGIKEKEKLVTYVIQHFLRIFSSYMNIMSVSYNNKHTI